MPGLAEGQASFSTALLDPGAPVPAEILRQGRQGQSRRFDVYRNNVMISLIEALEAAFPAVRRLVGAEFFKVASRIYIRHQPPTSPVLLLYGESFGDFLDNFEPAAGVPYLGDVARLEWARLKAYHAADAEALSISQLAALPGDALGHVTFTLHPSLTLLRSRFPVASLWAACSGTDPSVKVDMTQGEDVAVLRPDLQVDLRLLPPGGYPFVTRLAAGCSLGKAAAQAALTGEDFDLSEHLRGLFQLGAVVAVHGPGTG